MTEKLKPCPFCGGMKLTLWTNKNAMLFRYRIECDYCHFSTVPKTTKFKAIKAWNRRSDNG